MNRIVIGEEIGTWGVTATYIKSLLDGMSGDVVVEINSPGGSVFEGISIYNELKKYNRGKIEVIITGVAASIASYIALAGDTIKAYDNATYMIHNAWTFTYGDANELRKTADVLDGLSNIILNKYVEITRRSKDELKALMDAETYFFGEEILTAGFVDEIISTQRDDEAQNKSSFLALTKESFKSCQKNYSSNFSSDEFVQAVAKLTKDGVLSFEDKAVVEIIEEPKAKAIDDTKQQQRARELAILQREVQL